MLTPDKIAAMDAASGLKTTATQSASQNVSSSRADEIRSLAATAVENQKQTLTPDQVFTDPAHNFSDSVETSKGALKQLARDISSVGAQNAGPVGAAIMSDAKKRGGGAAKFAEAIDSFNAATEPSNALQKKGALETSQAEMLLPTDVAATKAKDVISPVVDLVKGALTPKPEIEKITEALTPVLTSTKTAKGIGAAAQKGEVFDASALDSVKRAVSAVQDVATTLGKKATDIIKPGIQQAAENGARLGQAIGDYSKNIVTPFLKNSGVNYNFSDLSKALELVKPSESLDTTALSTYNKVRERVLQTIANKVGPETKNISSVADMRKAATVEGNVAPKVLNGDVDFWDARKIIDQIVDEETKGKAWGDASVVGAKAAYKDLRNGFAQYLTEAFRYPGQMDKLNAANEFLKTNEVKGMDKTGWNLDQFEKQFGLVRNTASDSSAAQWDKYMSNMSSLYDGIANVTTKAAKENGKSWLALFEKENPTTFKAIEYGLGAVGAGALFKVGQEAL